MNQNQKDQDHQSKEEETTAISEDEVKWLCGIVVKKKTRRVIRIIMNCIILPLLLFIDISSVGIDIDHICWVILVYLILNVPMLKQHSDNDWMMGISG